LGWIGRPAGGGTPELDVPQAATHWRAAEGVHEHARLSHPQMPLIVGLNNHCSAAQQEVVAARTSANILATVCARWFRTDQLPLPAALANRIILRMRVVSTDASVPPSASSLIRVSSDISRPGVSVSGGCQWQCQWQWSQACQTQKDKNFTCCTRFFCCRCRITIRSNQNICEHNDAHEQERGHVCSSSKKHQ
jgi:hypothetical protein